MHGGSPSRSCPKGVRFAGNVRPSAMPAGNWSDENISVGRQRSNTIPVANLGQREPVLAGNNGFPSSYLNATI